MYCFSRKRREEYLKELMRDNTQLLINDIWKVWVRLFGECVVCCTYGIALFPVSL